MFQAWPVKMSSTAASSKPMLFCGNSALSANNNPGRNANTGMLWRISNNGISTRPARRSFAAQYPYSNVKISEMQ
jgi:hypothetical protein